jgi:hypothetical protein
MQFGLPTAIRFVAAHCMAQDDTVSGEQVVGGTNEFIVSSPL